MTRTAPIMCVAVLNKLVASDQGFQGGGKTVLAHFCIDQTTAKYFKIEISKEVSDEWGKFLGCNFKMCLSPDSGVES